MRILRNIDARLLNHVEWPTVLEEHLPSEKRELFLKRKAAVLAVLDGGHLSEARAIIGCKSREIARLVRRCVQRMPDGSLAGFRGLVPDFRTKSYERRAHDSENKAGLLSSFFAQHPTIERGMKDFVLRRESRLGLPAKAGSIDLRDRFLALCREQGITCGYPFNTQDKGARSLARWRDRLFDIHPREMTRAEYGEEAGRNVETGHSAGNAGNDPFTVWVIDEYTVDTELTVSVELPDGRVAHYPMKRCKVISVRRRGSRDILATKLVLKAEPNTSDFLEVVEAAIRPHVRMNFTVHGFQYPAGPCFASELPNCAWVLPDVIMLDNSKVHRSDDVRRAIVENIGASVQYGIVRLPKARGDIENWHSLLANDLRGLASTTATGPSDPRRFKAEEAAMALRIEAHHVQEFLELRAAQLNVTPLQSLKGVTPMEAFQDWASRAITRDVPERARDGFRLARLHVNVRIRCDKRNGRRPCVQFEFAKYYSERLDKLRSRAGELCVLVLSEADGTSGELFDAQGLKIDDVYTTGEWREPHRLSERRLFVDLRKKRVLEMPVGVSKIAALREYLASGATRNRSTALAYARMDRRAEAPNPKAAPVATVESPAPQTPSRSGVKMARLGNAMLPVKIGEMKAPKNWG